MSFLIIPIHFSRTVYCLDNYNANYVYQKISNGRPLTIKNTSASYHDGEAEWTILGAVQENELVNQEKEEWSVGDNPFEVVVIKDCFSDKAILPYSNIIHNSAISKSLDIKTSPGLYSSASFVLRSGEGALEDVHITVSDLHGNGEDSVIRAENVDIRGVKCWYQSGLNLRRTIHDKKRLTPELLLHDLNLVKVDHTYKVNLIRNLKTIRDAEKLLPFSIPAKSNQQIWITVHTPADVHPGKFSSVIMVSFTIADKKYTTTLKLNAEVIPSRLANPPIEYALFYLAYYDPMENSPVSRFKNGVQILAELKDMREHGLTNVAFNHRCTFSKDGEPHFSNLEPVVRLFREAGFSTKRFLYVDWQMSGWDNAILYRKKISRLKDLVSRYGFEELLVYNKDEQPYESLIQYRNTFKIAHELGVKNFVATDRSTAMNMRGLLDYAILPRDTPLRGLNLEDGGNLVLNGDMKIPLEQKGAGWISSNKNLFFIERDRLVKKRGEYAYFAQTLPIREGNTYILEYTVLKGHGSLPDMGLFLAAGGGSCVDKDIPMPTTKGVHQICFTSNGNRRLRIGASSRAEFELSNIRVREVTEHGKENSPMIIPWAYNDPQAGMELPGTYVHAYGESIVHDGYKGVCNFTYQSGGCWDDWGDQEWRPHCMTYATVGAPISTIQWEAWREAINRAMHAVSQ